MKFKQSQLNLYFKLANCIRLLTVDAIERANSGHPGMPLGMAKVMTVLAFDFLKFNPSDPTWFNRDRLILSNGHGSMLLYAFYYLAGYKDFNLEDIKNFRQLNSKTPGHPEYGLYSAIETTTGPLGQGFANAVGMAIAQKKYNQQYGSNVCNHKIYCIVGDGCLMEGISYETASLAGHLKLNNLIVLFDDNKITIDGRTSLTISENQQLKFNALGWQVYSINGHDPDQIYLSLENAQKSQQPVLIICNTIIGKGAINKMDSESAHGAPLGAEEAQLFRKNLETYEGAFAIGKEMLKLWRQAWLKNEEEYLTWKKNNQNISSFLPISFDLLSFKEVFKKLYNDAKNINAANSTRAASGQVISELIKISDKIICGSADLSLSNNIKNKFSNPITERNFSGNFIYYGVREHAMAAIMNGMAIYGLLPIGGTFLSFSDYMKAAIRLSAIMNLKVIYIMTHDSIGVGEDGPTHQPVEQLAALRAIPNLTVLRPADFIETIECWEVALSCTGPVVLALTRQTVPIVRNYNKNNLSSFGAYIILDCESEDIDIIIYASGSELSIALKVAKLLLEENFKIRVMSVPSFELFFKQDQNYIKSILGQPKIRVAIEAACSFGWHQFIGIDGMFFGVEKFGISAPAESVFEYFGLKAEIIASQIKKRLI